MHINKSMISEPEGNDAVKDISGNGATPQQEIFAPGLEGVVAAETRLSHIDGQNGQLVVAGFPIEEIATKSTFEEMIYLLWHDRLPSSEQLSDFTGLLNRYRTLPTETLVLLQSIAQAKKPVMDALRIASGTIDLDIDPDVEIEQRAAVIMARLPTIVASYWRLLNGKEPSAPNLELGTAASYLAMLMDSEPTQEQIRGMETYLNTVIEHGLNASTFTARVIIATQTDLTSAVVGAIGALKGPLHGGAPGPALDTVFEIGSAERAESVLREKLGRGERLMGFGHRVYKVRDPRAEVLSAAAQQLYQNGGDIELYKLAQHVEQTAVTLLKEAKPHLELQTNVEFYTALLLHGIGLETDLFSPTFAISRAGGWIAHCFEHLASGRIMRPRGRYMGDRNRAWQSLEERG